ncbi:MAG: TIGR04283 family arsenosugar biosynthesis glycosyltransferase [Elusimicrobiales bacterium]|nr:TIGR04283 family arsenosugar biosynthesis glycosyltransferase [Elusimicrobiales bacterium]
MKFSIIMPVYREEAGINAAARAAARALEGSGGELVIVDGGPAAGTLAALSGVEAVKLASAPGRGAQLNAGAAKAKGEALLFLHADTTLPQGALAAAGAVLASGEFGAGAFKLKIDSVNPWLRFVAWTANIRNLITDVPYGDQAVFIRKDIFERLGGFREIPVMEDIDFMERLRAAGIRIKILQACVLTSARRWENEGLLKATFMHHLLRFLWLAKADPAAIAAFRRTPSPAAWLRALTTRRGGNYAR